MTPPITLEDEKKTGTSIAMHLLASDEAISISIGKAFNGFGVTVIPIKTPDDQPTFIAPTLTEAWGKYIEHLRDKRMKDAH